MPWQQFIGGVVLVLVYARLVFMLVRPLHRQPVRQRAH